MAETQQFSRTESLPPEFLRQFFAGVPGANVPGVLPLLNQELVNRILGMGAEGATPFTYTGQRIADFTPAETEAFRLAGEGAGAYMPFINRATDLSEESLQDVRGTTGLGLDFLRSAGAEGAGATREALSILRGLPSQFQTAQGIGLGGLGMFNPNMAQGFYNPFEEQVVGQTLEDISERFGEAPPPHRQGADEDGGSSGAGDKKW